MIGRMNDVVIGKKDELNGSSKCENISHMLFEKTGCNVTKRHVASFYDKIGNRINSISIL